ncbi:hypothetical protein GP486_002978 [Trichoglossum hirsutum]|uniref:NACHT domain-containing protein n=1 Tax=Trichoglossum hirsutum TaxID=265104 RepID=A0A9P8LE61_9PEZI|nr:hypothetical protein GP486_002978 [Trichoglossum hirsutum]
MDPLSISASIVALLQLSSKVIKFLRDVKDAPDDVKRLMVEVSSTKGLLLTLLDLVESGEAGSNTVNSLNAPNGPLKQCRSALDCLAERVLPAVGLDKARKALLWPFQKGEVREILSAIERQKTLFSLALHNDHLSIVVDHLERSFENQNVAIAFIYCSYKERDDQKAVNLIASLLRHLIQSNPVISEEVISAYQIHSRNHTQPTLVEYSNLLRSEVLRFSKVFIAIDALDECSESDDTRDSLIAEIRKLDPIVRLLVTSRRISTIEREFKEAACVEIRASDGDVKRYLESRIDRERRLLRHVKADPDLRDTIIDTVAEKAKGMFLLAQLHMDSLAKKLNRRDVRRAIRDLPVELSDIYDEAMRRIESQDEGEASLAKRVLYWISYSFRPLTVLEIQHGLAVELKDVELNEEALPDEDDLVSLCAGLVVIDQESNVIRLVHYTTQEYFERIRIARFPNAHTDIAKACLVYILFDEFAKGPCGSDEGLEDRILKYPLIGYAARHWGDHARGGPEGEIQELALRLLEHQPKLTCSYQVFCLPIHRYPMYSHRYTKNVTGLHVAALFNLVTISRLLLERQHVYADSSDWYGRTPLSWAAESGHEAVVRLLAEHKNVNADSKDLTGLTPLSLAVWNGHKEVVQLLVSRHDVDADSKDEYGQTPLLWAVSGGQEEVVRLLSQREDVDPGFVGRGGETPLSLAAANGREAMVRLLTQCKGINGNSKNGIGRTPLSLAAKGGHESVVRLLIERQDVDLNSKDIDGQTPLSLAAKGGHEPVVRLLTECQDIDLNPKDVDGQTPLSLAVKGGHESVVRLLAKRQDVDLNSKDNDGRTPLSLAAGTLPANKVVVELLTESENVDADSRDKLGKTPLLWAAALGWEAVVQLLVNRIDIGADSRDKSGRTPLSWAAGNGREAVVQLLAMREDVDVDSKDKDGLTPLAWAARGGYEAAVRLLAERGDVDTDAKDNGGRTPLSWAAMHGHEVAVRLLAERGGVGNDTKDSSGRTPLSWAAMHDHGAVVRLLAERGDVDTDTKDNSGRTPLAWAAMHGHEATVRLLAGRGDVNTDTKDNSGRTPLSWAAMHGHEATVRLLAERDDVDTNTKDNDGRTPLSWAALSGREEVVRVLAGREDVDTNAKDADGCTLLSLAMKNGHEGVVQLLAPLTSDR